MVDRAHNVQIQLKTFMKSFLYKMLIGVTAISFFIVLFIKIVQANQILCEEAVDGY